LSLGAGYSMCFDGQRITVVDTNGIAITNVGSTVSDVAYDATTWDGVTTIAPSKNAVRDKIESITSGGTVLLIDQTTPQTVLNGTPVFSQGLNIGSASVAGDEYIYAKLGTELTPAITNALWTPGAGWTITDGTHIATRVASAVTTLVPATPITANVTKKYKIVFTISSWTAGTITVTFGGVTSTPLAGNQTVSLYDEPITTGNLIFTPDASFAGVISAVSVKELTDGNLTVENDIISYGSRGHINSMARFIRHTSEMWTNTLLDRSQSTLSCTGGVLTYTLTAVFGHGKFDFNGIIFPDTANTASIALTGGTDAAPRTNYVYFGLVGNTPTLAVALDTAPTSSYTAPIIRVARFVVGAVSGSSYTIYAYERYRQELDTFVNRVINRLESFGDGYDSGLLPTVTSTTLSIATGVFYNGGIFQMTSANAPTAATGFYWIDGLGAFHYSTALTDLTKYGDSGNTTVNANQYQNIVWGIVPTTTTASGTVPTTVKLFATLQSTATSYTTVQQAIQDLSNALTVYPPNAEVAKVFVPICRTILKANLPAFQQFLNSAYFLDLRGYITGAGTAAQSVDVSGLVPKTTTITATAPITIDGTTSADLSANRTVAITAATTGAPGTMSAADKTKLDAIASGATANAKATGAELVTGTDDVKFATALGLVDKMNAPGIIGGTTPGVVYGLLKEQYITSSGSLTALQCSKSIVSNYGMTDADLVANLPTAAEGLSFICILPAVRARYFKLRAAANDKIYLSGVAGSDNGYVGVASGYATGSSAQLITFKASDGGFDWFCLPIFGAWVQS
jgi:hypothetical protein